MTVMSADESADQIWSWIIIPKVHMHHSQPLDIRFHTAIFWFCKLRCWYMKMDVLTLNLDFFDFLAHCVIHMYSDRWFSGPKEIVSYPNFHPIFVPHRAGNSCKFWSALAVMHFQFLFFTHTKVFLEVPGTGVVPFLYYISCTGTYCIVIWQFLGPGLGQ